MNNFLNYDADDLLMLAAADQADRIYQPPAMQPPPLIPAPQRAPAGGIQQIWTPQPQPTPAPAAAAAAGGFDMNAMRDAIAEIGRNIQPPAAPPAATQRVRLPEYDGSSDVEGFIDNFLGVMDANNWTPAIALLHLRSCLRGSARDAARGATLREALQSLRNRFDVTESQARDQLLTLRYDGRQNLHEWGAEVERLTHRAFGRAPEALRGELAREAFRNSLNNCELQQHLLNARGNSVQELVVAAQAYLQVPQTVSIHHQRQRPRVASLDEFAPLAEASPATDVSVMLSQLMKMVEANSQAISRLSQAQTNTLGPASQTRTQAPSSSATGGASYGTPGPCFKCKGPHLKRDCPLVKSGNDNRPRQ